MPSRNNDAAGTLWLTFLVTVGLFVVGYVVVEVVTHRMTILAILLAIVIWITALPFWVWISISIILGAGWIARAIKNHP